MSFKMRQEERTRPLLRSFSDGPPSEEGEPLLGRRKRSKKPAWRRVSEDFYTDFLNPMASPASANSIVVDVDVTRQSSVVTIFAIWNTMMGTSLLAMPWGIERAGLFLGVSLVLFMGALCLYTTYCNLRSHQQFGSATGEISDLAKTLLGPYAEIISKIFSLIVLLGANIVYWILMSNFLFNSVNSLHDKLYSNETLNETVPSVICPVATIPDQPAFVDASSLYASIWNLELTVPIYLTILIGPLLNFKSPTFFTKFNSLGTLSVMYLVIFVLVKGSTWGYNTNINDIASINYAPLASLSFPATSGMLALSYFIHNIIISVMRNNADQKCNGRDLSIAYALVTITYLVIGTVFYMTFPLAKSCIQDNLLNNFSGQDILTVIARIFLLFQLVTVFPLIAYMLRVQTLLTFTGLPYPSKCHVIAFNAILIFICVLFAVCLPKIGTIIRFTGAVSGMVHIFTLPCLLRIAALYRNGTITTTSWILHLVIPVFGAANLIGQFFVTDG